MATALAVCAPAPALALPVTPHADAAPHASASPPEVAVQQKAHHKNAHKKKSHKKKSSTVQVQKKKSHKKRSHRKRSHKKKSHKKKSGSGAQSCSVNWRGYVLPSDHNYAGIGAYNGSDRYMCKPTPQLGIRAQIQHLRNYADAGSRSTNLGAPFEPRPKYDANAFDTFPYKGAAPRWRDLEGKWAVPGDKYWDTIKDIYNTMRKYNGLGSVSDSYQIMGSSALSPDQIAAYVKAVGNPWKPEIGPLSMAQLYVSEGNKAGVRGDVAFCQSILETGWFGWPGSAAAIQVERTPETAPSTTSTTSSTTTSTSTTTTTTSPKSSTTPGSTPDSTPDTTTTSTTSTTLAPSAASSTTTTTTTTAPVAPAVDPVLAAYLELLATTTIRY